MLLPKLEAEIAGYESNLSKLKAFMDNPTVWDCLSDEHQDLLVEQESAMLTLVNLLYARKALLMGEDINELD